VNTQGALRATLERHFPWCAEWEGELTRLYRAYVERKLANQALDYDDLLLYWHAMLGDERLAREIGAGWGTITHHLEKLERASLVATRKVNNQKCFFENGGVVSRQDMAIASAVKGDTAGHIAAFVQNHPMTSQKALAESLGISPALASFHVKKLASLGVLDRVRHGKETLLTTSESLRRVLASDRGSLAPSAASEEGFQYSS
jgi:DNA-binding MarR family transcriptional regulator